MPAKEIKELRKAGKIAEAYTMANAELGIEPENIWSKRNMSWVLYSQLNNASGDLIEFVNKLKELKQLELPASEDMFWENISIVISKAARFINSKEPIILHELHLLFDEIKQLPIKKNSKWYSVMYSAFHKGMKESSRFLEFADWWDFENFMPEDFKKEKMPNGVEVMAVAEQAYIAYAKHLLPKQTQFGEVIFDRDKAQAFLPILSDIVEKYTQFQYPGYYKAKLLLALGEQDNILSALLPFARKKRNEFWVWEILAQAFSNDAEKVFSCYCKALSCKSPEGMLVKIRQKMGAILISRQLYNEAKTEIELLVEARNSHGFKIPNEVINWQSQDWYKTAAPLLSNLGFYKQFSYTAESLLFSDIPEEMVFVDFVNTDKKILNYIASESKFGFFKYERFFKDVKVGDTLKVRFQGGAKEGMCQLHTAVKVNDETFKSQFLKVIEGNVRIPAGRTFGFLNDVFIHPSLVVKLKITDGLQLKANAIKTFNQDKKAWSWKVISV